MLKRLPQPETRARIRADIERDGLNNWGRIPDWDCVQISISPNLPQHAGKTIAALAAERGADPVDALCQYLADDKGATRVLVTSISEDDIAEIVRDPTALVGSDGNCVATYGTASQGMPHPRFYGTFPRIIDHYVRRERVVPLETAIHKMTGATAKALKLKDRGLLREGYRADVAIFDPADFRDRATYADPHQYPTGARTSVIVNGEPVVENAAHTGALPGRVLRRDAAARWAEDCGRLQRNCRLRRIGRQAAINAGSRIGMANSVCSADISHLNLHANRSVAIDAFDVEGDQFCQFERLVGPFKLASLVVVLHI